MMTMIHSVTLLLLAVGLIFNGLAVVRLRRAVEALARSHTATIEGVGELMAALGSASLAPGSDQTDDDSPPTALH